MAIHGEIDARAAVSAAGVTILGIAVIADLADREIDDAVAAGFSRAAIAAAAVARDQIAVIAYLARIDNAVAAVVENADFLLAGMLGRGRALHRGLCGGGAVTRARRVGNEQSEPHG